MVRKDSLAKMGTLSPVHQLSMHKNNIKNWRSNSMYKSVRYTHCSVFGFSRQFAANIFAFLMICAVIIFCINDIEQQAMPKGKHNINEMQKQAQPANNNRDSDEGLAANDCSLPGGIPALDVCFKIISLR